MRFLLEFMSCCAPNSRTPAVKEETKSLVGWVAPSLAAPNRGVKRGRTAARTGRNGVSVPEWRPSLSSICEDNVFQERNGNQEAAVVGSSSSSSDRNLKRKVTSKPKTRSSSHREDARRQPVQLIMPAFSPAPFMF